MSDLRRFVPYAGPVTTERAPRNRVFSAIRTDWREIGGLGRFALLGVLVSLVVAVVLGFSITNGARDHLLESRLHLLTSVTDELSAVDLDSGGNIALGPSFDEAVRLRLLGGETVRVKLWLSDGTIAYSDSPELVGKTFELSTSARTALSGSPSYRVSDLSDPAHAGERDLGRLIEFYVPFGPPQNPVAAFEIEQLTDSLDESMAQINRHVWLSIGSGIGLLGIFLAALVVIRARDAVRRRRQAESILGALLHAQDEERRRVVGALHDDVGQPLYRLLYGIEGSRGKLDADHPVANELERLAGVVRDIDSTLRRELRLMHEGSEAEAGLAPAIKDLVELTRLETGLNVDVDVNLEIEPEPVQRAALYRAAREGLTNARRHSGAERIHVELTGDAGVVGVEVIDDGTGGRIQPGLGLTTTKERLEAIGGGMAVIPRRGAGTRFRAWVPVSSGPP